MLAWNSWMLVWRDNFNIQKISKYIIGFLCNHHWVINNKNGQKFHGMT
jgi:hypothetical protein